MARPQRRARRFDSRRRRKVSILTKEKVDYVDYKDVTLLRRFISDRAKIRPRRVSGNNEQQQRAVALAIKNAREMALLPYENRITTQRRSPDRRSYEAEDAAESDGEASSERAEAARPPARATAGIPAPPRRQPASVAGKDKTHETAPAAEGKSAAESAEASEADAADGEAAPEDPVEGGAEESSEVSSVESSEEGAEETSVESSAETSEEDVSSEEERQ